MYFVFVEYVFFTKNGQKWIKMGNNGQKIVKNCEKLGKNGVKREIIEQKWGKIGQKKKL